MFGIDWTNSETLLLNLTNLGLGLLLALAVGLAILDVAIDLCQKWRGASGDRPDWRDGPRHV